MLSAPTGSVPTLLLLLLIATAPLQSQDTTAALCRPTVAPRAGVIHRGLPYDFYKGEIERLRRTYRDIRILAERPSGEQGSKLEYALLVYQTGPADSVTLVAVARDWAANRAWDLRARCTVEQWPTGLILLTESLARLPNLERRIAQEIAVARALGESIAAEGPVLRTPVGSGYRVPAERWVHDNIVCGFMRDCTETHYLAVRDAFATGLGARVSGRDTGQVSDASLRVHYRLTQPAISDSATTGVARVQVTRIMTNSSSCAGGCAALGEITEYLLHRDQSDTWKVVGKAIIVQFQ